MASHRAPERTIDVMIRDLIVVMKPAHHIIVITVLHIIATTVYYELFNH